MLTETRMIVACVMALLAGGCAHEMTVGEFVYTYLVPDAKLRALNAAADAACQAYQFQGSTSAESMNDDFDGKLMSMVNTANDKWRSSKMVRITELSPAMSVNPDDLRLTDLGKPEYYVPVNGASCIVYRVRATPNQVTLVGTSTTGGVPIIAFDSRLNPSVEGEFAAYLGNDTVMIRGAATKILNRTGTAVTRSNVFAPSGTPQTTPAAALVAPYSPPPIANPYYGNAPPQAVTPPFGVIPGSVEAPPAAGGCVKDTDCKGDRICVQRACVSPTR